MPRLTEAMQNLALGMRRWFRGTGTESSFPMRLQDAVHEIKVVGNYEFVACQEAVLGHGRYGTVFKGKRKDVSLFYSTGFFFPMKWVVAR